MSKKLFLTLFMFAIPMLAQAFENPLAKLADEYNESNTKDITVVKINKALINLIGSTESINEEVDEKTGIEGSANSFVDMISGLENIVIITYECTDEYNNAEYHYDKIMEVIKDNYKEYSVLMEVSSPESKVKCLFKTFEKDSVAHFLLVVTDEKETTAISLVGDIDVNKLSNLTNGINSDMMKGLNIKVDGIMKGDEEEK